MSQTTLRTPTTGTLPQLPDMRLSHRLMDGQFLGRKSMLDLRLLDMLHSAGHSLAVAVDVCVILSDAKTSWKRSAEDIHAIGQVLIDLHSSSSLGSDYVIPLANFLVAPLGSGLFIPKAEELKKFGSIFTKICSMVSESEFEDSRLIESIIGSAMVGLFKREEDLLAVQAFIEDARMADLLKAFNKPPQNPSRNHFYISIDDAPCLQFAGYQDIRPIVPGLEVAVRLMNQFLEPQFKIREVNLIFDAVQLYSGGYNPRQIILEIPKSNDKPYITFIKSTSFHEAAHGFDEQIRTLKPEEWETFNSKFHQMRKHHPHLFSLFKESTYSVMNQDAGHPQSNSKELFASCSTVLILRSDEFIQRVSELSAPEMEVAFEVAKFVIGQYFKQNPEAAGELFNPNLVEFLGLDKE